MNKNIILFCIITSFFFSCKRRENYSTFSQQEKSEISQQVISHHNLEKIKLSPYKTGYLYDQLIDSVSFVKLETTDDNLIGSIYYLLFTDDKIIAVDKENSKTITVYDKQGKFLNKVSRLGQAPDEYSFLSYVSLTADKSQLVVMDTGNMKLKYFNIDDNTSKLTGSSLAKIVDRPYIFYNMEFVTDQVVVGYYDAGNKIPGTSDKHTFIVTDLKGNINYSKYKSYYSNKFCYSTEYPLHRFGSDVYLNPPFNDTIFQVSENGFIAKYVLQIDGGGKLLIDETTTDKSLKEQLDRTNYFNSHFVELKDLAVFHYMGHSDYSTWGMYVKSENKTYDCNGKCKNPLFSFFHIPWFYYSDNTIVVPVSASSIVSARNDILKKCNSRQAEILLENLTEDDNPILFFYHMKTNVN